MVRAFAIFLPAQQQLWLWRSCGSSHRNFKGRANWNGMTKISSSPVKVFAGTKNYVAAKGTLSADWIGEKNNTFSFYCDPEECIVASIGQIGPKLIGSMDGPIGYPIKHWTEDGEVVAEENDLCSRITITLDRRTEAVLWVEAPINQTTLACKNADDGVRKATLEASLYWRRHPPK